jgi:hypothetical protein
MDRDAEHLRLLSIFHYVVGGLVAFCACFFIIHIVMGAVIASSPSSFSGSGGPPPRAFGLFFMIIGSLAVLFGWTMAALIIFAGYSLGRRKNYLFCMIVAGISCLFMPFGTVLGIFTILVLQRPRVREMFNQPATA